MHYFKKLSNWDWNKLNKTYRVDTHLKSPLFPQGPGHQILCHGVIRGDTHGLWVHEYYCNKNFSTELRWNFSFHYNIWNVNQPLTIQTDRTSRESENKEHERESVREQLGPSSRNRYGYLNGAYTISKSYSTQGCTFTPFQNSRCTDVET